MKDIARDLGVSVVTVSKVLRKHTDISELTRERVLKRAKELNYRPNLAARTLVTGRTLSMGLVVPDLTHPFFGVLATGMSKILRGRGYSLIISCSEEDPEMEKEEIEQLLTRRVDALVVASAQMTVESFHRIEEHKTPYILVDRQFAGLPANFVGVDDQAIGMMATQHLLDAGCQRLALIGGSRVSTSLGRREGFRTVLANHGIPITESYMISREHGDKGGEFSGYTAMQKLLQLDPRPDGVFCHNDAAAMGAMNAILEAGLSIPEDIAIIGCGNLNYADSLRVPLSTIDQETEAIGEHAAELAFRAMGSKNRIRPETVMVEPKLIVRASTRRC